MRVNRQNDWLINNVLTLTADLICEEFNSLLDFGEISKLLVWNLIKLCPWLDFFRGMIETQFQGSSGTDTITSWEEIKTNDGLKDR
jgi:hypothetical protein